MELMLRRQKSSPQSKESPLGAIGTEWCVINKEWWDGWCKYAGGQGGAVRSPGGSPTSSPRLSQHSQPGMVDNWAIVTKQGGIMQVAQGLTVGKQVRFTSTFTHCLSPSMSLSQSLSVSISSITITVCLYDTVSVPITVAVVVTVCLTISSSLHLILNIHYYSFSHSHSYFHPYLFLFSYSYSYFHSYFYSYSYSYSYSYLHF